MTVDVSKISFANITQK